MKNYPISKDFRDGEKFIRIWGGPDDEGARTFFSEKNEGAKTFMT